MKLSVEALNILLLLLPGFLAGQLLYTVASISNVATTERLYHALMFSFAIYLLTAVGFSWEPLVQVRQAEDSLEYRFSGNRWFVVTHVALIIALPIAIVALVHSDRLHWILRLLRLTSKSSRPNAWVDSLLGEQRHVVVHLKDGRRLRGFPSRFSSDPEEGFIYLSNPAWINDAPDAENPEHYFETDAHGILVNRSEMDLLEFSLTVEELRQLGGGNDHGEEVVDE